MATALKSVYKERAKRAGSPAHRFVDCAVRLAIFVRDDNDLPVRARKHPAWQTVDAVRYLDEAEGTVYGGIYDTVARRYVRNDDGTRKLPDSVHEIPCHPGQVRVLTLVRKGIRRIIALGATGAGKTEVTVRRAILNIVKRPNSRGGITAPTGKQLRVAKRKFLDLLKKINLFGGTNETNGEVYTKNGCVVDLCSTKRSSNENGPPTQGRDWDWCVADESSSMDEDAHTDLWDRGRAAGDDYQVFEGTTNDDYAGFVMRLERMKLQPDKYLIVKFWGEDNPWVTKSYLASKLDEYGGPTSRKARRRIFLEDVPPERLVYARFALGRHVRPLPPGALDITHRVCHEAGLGEGIRYVMGQDFGVLVNATVVLKAYQLPDRKGEVFWWAVDEVTTKNEYSDRHARLIKSKYNPDEFVVIADPHFNVREGSDKSDYTQFRNEGITIFRAAGDASQQKKQITVRHRIAMVNMLFEDANVSTSRCISTCPKKCIGHGEAHLFIACEGDYQPKCRELAKALITGQYNEHGMPQPERKDERVDWTHWPDALGYGLWKFEKFRGNGQIRIVSPDNRRDFWEKDGA